MTCSVNWRTLAAGLLASMTFAASAPASGGGISPVRPALPLVFEPNLGQTTPETRYFSRGGSHALFLNAQESVLVLRSKDKSTERIRMHLEGANRDAAIDAVLAGVAAIVFYASIMICPAVQ